MSISKVALRRKALSNGKKESLVLEFTQPILDKDTLCRVHKKHRNYPLKKINRYKRHLNFVK